jgi:hypothetical protein
MNLLIGAKAAGRSRVECLDGLCGAVRRHVCPQDLFNSELQGARLLVFGKLDSNALGPIVGSLGRCYPGYFAGDWVTLRVIGQRQQHIHIVTQSVFPGCRNKDAAFREQRDIGRIQGRFLLDGQLDNTRARRCGGWIGHARILWFGVQGDLGLARQRLKHQAYIEGMLHGARGLRQRTRPGGQGVH